MTIEQAITKAITSGYIQDDIRGRKVKVKTTSDLFIIQAGNFEMTIPESMFFLDASFWQSLGKAMGWEIPKDYRTHRKGSHSDDYGGYGDDFPCDCDKPKDWKGHWHRFIDHLAEGKTAEEFFENLP